MKGTVKAVIAGVVVIFIGVAVFLVGLGLNDWNLDEGNFEMKKYQCASEIHTIKLDFGVGTLKTQFYDGDRIEVEYPETRRLTTNFSESNGVLNATANVGRHWFTFWDFTKKLPTTVVSIPNNSVVNLDLDVDAGTVTVAEGKYGKVSIELNAGTLNFGKTECAEISCKVNAGTLNFGQTVCSGEFVCKLSAGTLRAESVASSKVTCKLSAGTVTLNGIVCNNITVDVSAGTANLRVKGEKAAYTILTDVSAGRCNVQSQQGTDPDKRIDVDVSAGSANISFE